MRLWQVIRFRRGHMVHVLTSLFLQVPPSHFSDILVSWYNEAIEVTSQEES